jgi:predicted nuclease of restriction endonuclease-like (RecB) superfamily
MEKKLTSRDPNLENLVFAIGSEIEQTQVRTIVAANKQMLFHYWKMGQYILYNQKVHGWGAKIIETISKSIQATHPNKKGYSSRNLKYMCQFAKLYPLKVLAQIQAADVKLAGRNVEIVLQLIKQLNDNENIFGQEPLAQIQMDDTKSVTNGQQHVSQNLSVTETMEIITQMSVEKVENIFENSPVSQINWASHVVLMNNSLPLGIRYWYMKEQVQFGWSSNILNLQIESCLYQRQMKEGKVNNFTRTLPAPQSDLANYLLKDPYIFDVVNIKESADERDVENQLIKKVTDYLLEMGNGFAFVAKQKHFQVNNKDFYADLILYNIPLHAYVVVELKATLFKPEYVGQLNFYVNLVNNDLRGEHDNPTIGLLLCRGKDEVVAQYALDGYLNAIGVSDYQLSKAIPEGLKSALPSIEDVEEELTARMNKK